jgi:hypothetical protein
MFSIFNFFNDKSNDKNNTIIKPNNIITNILSNIKNFTVNFNSVHTFIFKNPGNITIVDLLECIINATKYSYIKNNCYISSSLLDNENIYSYYFKDNNFLSVNICNNLIANLMRFTEAHFLILICLEFNVDDINDINFFQGQYIAIFCKSNEKKYIDHLNKDKKYNCLFEINHVNEFSLYIFSK